MAALKNTITNLRLKPAPTISDSAIQSLPPPIQNHMRQLADWSKHAETSMRQLADAVRELQGLAK